MVQSKKKKIVDSQATDRRVDGDEPVSVDDVEWQDPFYMKRKRVFYPRG